MGCCCSIRRRCRARGPTPERRGATAAAIAELPWWRRAWVNLRRYFTPAKKRRAAEEWGTNGKSLREVAAALAGKTEATVSVDAADETIASVAAPIERDADTIRGALLLSTQGGDIDSVIASERWALVRFFLVLAAVMFLLSLSLAHTIAEPVRKLAEAAERVRRGIKSRRQIPDFTARSDEIGNLSGALRDMTQALYNRMDAIESFAADVAHELKNPLTSLRSAVETLPRVKTDASRERLLDIMQHDVRRLDRLISDISDASRLDAELARGEADAVDLVEIVKAVVAMVEDSQRSHGVRLKLTVERRAAPRASDFIVLGYDSRLAQIVTNLIDNACSFSQPGGEVRVTLRRVVGRPTAEGKPASAEVLVVVDDDGPGIPPHALDRIFERFYTDRPEQGFGQNSGLGLSISRQIVEAHGGRVWAENRPGAPGAATPARTGRRPAMAPGRASSSPCRRSPLERDAAGVVGAACDSRAGWRKRGVIARPVGRRQERARPGAARNRQKSRDFLGPRRRRPGLRARLRRPPAGARRPRFRR